MSSKVSKKHLQNRNLTLREEHTRLKHIKEELISHIGSILKRSKKLVTLKAQIQQDICKARDQVDVESISKQPVCNALREQLKEREGRENQEIMRLKNKQEEYNLLLNDYDATLSKITGILQTAKRVEGQIQAEKESSCTIQTMIHDYQRLKRVLQEEKKYFRELSHAEEKSHAERMNEFKLIRTKLIEEQNCSGGNARQSNIRFGLIRLFQIQHQKFREHAQCFLRPNNQIYYNVKLGIQKLNNFLSLSQFKQLQTVRQFFVRWHYNLFSSANLTVITQKALASNFENKSKLRVISIIQQKSNYDNLCLLQLFQKVKFILETANAAQHKDKHIGFNIWRQNCKQIKEKQIHLENIMEKMQARANIRQYFRIWKDNINMANRFQTASYLLEQFDTTKELARRFRKWRFQVSRMELFTIKQYAEKIRTLNLIKKRLKYQKRKVKALTILQLKMSSIQLRKYFNKYWENVKAFRIRDGQETLEAQQGNLTHLRTEHKVLAQNFKQSTLKLSFDACERIILRNKLSPYLKIWKNNSNYLNKRNFLLFSLILRKQGRQKLAVMNQLRRMIQNCQKRSLEHSMIEMSNKIEGIKEQSLQCRQALGNCLEQVAVEVSYKLLEILTMNQDNKKRRFIYRLNLVSIDGQYRTLLLRRLSGIISKYYYRGAMIDIRECVANRSQDLILDEMQKKCIKNRNKKIMKKAFQAILLALSNHKNGFSRLIHIENVMVFYKMACGFQAIKRQAAEFNLKCKQKHYNDFLISSKMKNQQAKQLQTEKNRLQTILLKILDKFIRFDERFQYIKQERRLKNEQHKIFKIYRENVERQIYRQKVLRNLGEFLRYKNMFIFWKGFLITSHKTIIQRCQNELANISRKKKSFDDKNTKTIQAIQLKMKTEIAIYQQRQNSYRHYKSKYQKLINNFQRKHSLIQYRHKLSAIFNVWKRQYKGAKAIAVGTAKLLQKKLVNDPFQMLRKCFEKCMTKERSELIIGKFLRKKNCSQLKNAFHLWRCNIKSLGCEIITQTLDNIDDLRESLFRDCHLTAHMASKQAIRHNTQKLISSCFMAFKAGWLQVCRSRKKIAFFQARKTAQTKRSALNSWKWFLYYKKTKRSYLKYKKEKFQQALKRDVFSQWKAYLQKHHRFARKVQNSLKNWWKKLSRECFCKLVNWAIQSRQNLYYRRKRALHSLLRGKETRVKCLKKRILDKWHAWLIPRTHYLPMAIQGVQQNILQRTFAIINERKYQNMIYIKNIADQVTSLGYGEINENTNSLIAEGFNPQQIKEYLKSRNIKDSVTIQKVVSHFKSFASKQGMVRAFHSWQEYVILKKKLKKALSKVLNIAGGINRYWNRWKNKDIEFQKMLQRQSRGNMLLRFQQLGKQLKGYKKDINNSQQHCKQLKDINDQYERDNSKVVEIALATFSANLRKGLRQGFMIWRQNSRQLRRRSNEQLFEQISAGIQMLNEKRQKLKYSIATIRQQNSLLRQKCCDGFERSKMMEKLLIERDNLSVNLADKEHNLKLLLEDNLRLKQKIKKAQNSATTLIQKVQGQIGN